MKKYLFVTIACLTLGLAPVVPEPHIIGKVQWIWGGAKGMKLLDWWDTFLHGTPWIILFYFLLNDSLSGLHSLVK